MITAAVARASAHAWVERAARPMPGYRAAFLAGSIAALPGGVVVPAWSDTDVMVVLEGQAPSKAGKLLHNGVLLDGTFLSDADFATPDAVLGAYHRAHALANGMILDDPAGWLAELQTVVRDEFPGRRWVEARCIDARKRVTGGFQALAETGSLAERAQAWVFPTGVMTHILLAAGLANPTVRRRYETARDLLATHHRLDLHERLLESLGSSRMTRLEAERHLAAVTQVYDAASPIRADAYRFSSDISVAARPISIDGSQNMIRRGYHREAVFWLVVTWSRALQKLAQGPDPAAAEPFEPGFAHLLADLGIASFHDFLERRDRALDLLPEVWRVAGEIMDANPEITE